MRRRLPSRPRVGGRGRVGLGPRRASESPRIGNDRRESVGWRLSTSAAGHVGAVRSWWRSCSTRSSWPASTPTSIRTSIPTSISDFDSDFVDESELVESVDVDAGDVADFLPRLSVLKKPDALEGHTDRGEHLLDGQHLAGVGMGDLGEVLVGGSPAGPRSSRRCRRTCTRTLASEFKRYRPMRCRSAVQSFPRPEWAPGSFPATKAVPKELFPIGDQPAIQIVIDEALGAGHRSHRRREQPRRSRRSMRTSLPTTPCSTRSRPRARSRRRNDCDRSGVTGASRSCTRTTRRGSVMRSGAPARRSATSRSPSCFPTS